MSPRANQGVTTEWEVNENGFWRRVERGLVLRVSARRHGYHYAFVDAAAGGRSVPELSGVCESEGAARAWCDRWAGVVLRELAADSEVAP